MCPTVMFFCDQTGSSTLDAHTGYVLYITCTVIMARGCFQLYRGVVTKVIPTNGIRFGEAALIAQKGHLSYYKFIKGFLGPQLVLFILYFYH